MIDAPRALKGQVFSGTLAARPNLYERLKARKTPKPLINKVGETTVRLWLPGLDLRMSNSPPQTGIVHSLVGTSACSYSSHSIGGGPFGSQDPCSRSCCLWTAVHASSCFWRLGDLLIFSAAGDLPRLSASCLVERLEPVSHGSRPEPLNERQRNICSRFKMRGSVYLHPWE